MSRTRNGRRGARVVGVFVVACVSTSLVSAVGAQEPTPSEPAAPDASGDEEAPALIRIQEASDEVLAEYQATAVRLTEVRSEIAVVNEQIPELEASVAIVHDRLQRRAAALYKDGTSGGGMAIFHDDPQTASRRSDLGRAAARADSADVATLRSMREALDALRADLEAREAEIVQLVADLEQQSALLQDGLLALTGGLATDARLCPVQGPALFRDDWGEPRSDDRTHQGTDIFGLHGSENVALVAGTITQANEEIGGLSVYLQGDDGHVYYYTHLAGFEGPPRAVEAGEVIGYTGTTGNAVGTPSHTHFEIHEGGATKINPYPTLRHLCLGDRTPEVESES